MSLELINTLGTVITVVIVAAAAIAALVQLRHLRAGNQINAMLSIGEKLQSGAFQEAQEIVSRQLRPALDDVVFRNYNTALGRGLPIPDVDPRYVELRRATVLIGNSIEELGILVKNGIVDKKLFLDRYTFVVVRNWNILEGFTALSPDATGTNALWENFEYLTVLCQDWERLHPSSYPKGARRLQPHNPWPVPPLPTAA